MCYAGNIKQEAKQNNFYRKVLYTAKHSQLVLMSLKPGQEIGEEVHDNVDQSFYVVSGKGVAEIGGEPTEIGEGSFLLIMAETKHNIKNTGSMDLKVFTIYAPPQHPEGTVHETKPEESYA